MKLLGLTGGIASGKSTVAAIMRRLGAAIINADELSREVVQPGQDAWKEIITTFGPDIVQGDETLDRRKLRRSYHPSESASSGGKKNQRTGDGG